MLVAAQSPGKPLRVAMSSGDTDLGGWRAANDTVAGDASGRPVASSTAGRSGSLPICFRSF